MSHRCPYCGPTADPNDPRCIGWGGGKSADINGS